ncbi:hypothetical protein PVAP13_4NG178711 [Panicum virgatum]|uniref:Uncharacterized protein n=1 Tax=Panicum virgatum TaxID=38727 RepID=A0A8T0T6F3_PANVG|nr:hypothetical protein PVAP13_4NG178711 [Panicum virgatum]
MWNHDGRAHTSEATPPWICFHPRGAVAAWLATARVCVPLGMATGLSPSGFGRTFCSPSELNSPAPRPRQSTRGRFSPSPSPNGDSKPDGDPNPEKIPQKLMFSQFNLRVY